MSKTLLTLKTNATSTFPNRHIVIDGTKYRLRWSAEVRDARQFQQLIAIERLTGVIGALGLKRPDLSKLDEAGAQELVTALRTLVTIGLDAPAAVIDRLNVNQQMAIATAYISAPPSAPTKKG